ncbi:hypothetical protein ACYSNM_05530 [Myroides sp. LJL116]
MALLEDEKYELVLIEARQAMTAVKQERIKDYLNLAELGWSKFPEPKQKWIQGYNYAKNFFNWSLKLNDLEQANKWLERMIANNEHLAHSDEEVLFNKAKYLFEVDQHDQALQCWKEVVKEAGYRYFEREDSKYLNFYLSQTK